MLDRDGKHSSICHVGAAHCRPHNAIVAVLMKAGQECGWETDKEVNAPDLLQVKTEAGWRLRPLVLAEGVPPAIVDKMEKKEARLDFVAWSPMATTDLRVDVTVRHPCSQR